MPRQSKDLVIGENLALATLAFKEVVLSNNHVSFVSYVNDLELRALNSLNPRLHKTYLNMYQRKTNLIVTEKLVHAIFNLVSFVTRFILIFSHHFYLVTG